MPVYVRAPLSSLPVSAVLCTCVIIIIVNKALIIVDTVNLFV